VDEPQGFAGRAVDDGGGTGHGCIGVEAVAILRHAAYGDGPAGECRGRFEGHLPQRGVSVMTRLATSAAIWDGAP
jgi:hypothetical protein